MMAVIFTTYLKACCKRITCHALKSVAERCFRSTKCTTFLIGTVPLYTQQCYFTEDKLTEGFSFITSKELYINR